MAEQPAESSEAWTSFPAPDEAGEFHPMAAFPADRQRPSLIVRADLRPALALLCGVALIGIPLGLVWSWLAPAQRVRAYGGGRLFPLPVESYHRFDDLVVFLLIGFGAGALTGLAAWLLRARRGPVVLVATVAGSLLASWLAARVGLAVAGAQYPVATNPAVGAIFAQSPRLESAWTLLAQPLAAALIYGTASAWNGMDDLGRDTP